MKDNNEKKKILIVDDEKEIVSLVSMHLRMVGFDVIFASHGEGALELISTEKPSLIILDIMLPKIDGWEVCKGLRENPHTKDIPVIMLTGRTQLEDKLKGFEVGADDYITKPFSPRELVVRVKRVLARAEPKVQVAKYLMRGNLEIDLMDFTVRVLGKEVSLTKRERAILKALVARRGELLTNEEILDAVWNDDPVEYGNIDVHIRHLREKIEQDPNSPKIIKTVKGEGYKFEP